jgi:hypothetical protein
MQKAELERAVFHHSSGHPSRDRAFLSSTILVRPSPGLLRLQLRVRRFEGDLSYVLIIMEEQSVSMPCTFGT